MSHSEITRSEDPKPEHPKHGPQSHEIGAADAGVMASLDYMLIAVLAVAIMIVSGLSLKMGQGNGPGDGSGQFAAQNEKVSVGR